MNTNIPFYAGESKPIDFDLTPDLRPGQTVSSATVEIEAGALVTLVGGSVAYSPDGRTVQAQFLVSAAAPVGARYTVTLVAILQNPTAAAYRLPGVIQVMRVPQ